MNTVSLPHQKKKKKKKEVYFFQSVVGTDDSTSCFRYIHGLQSLAWNGHVRRQTDRETDRQTDSVCVCVRERETDRQAVCVWERERDRETDRQRLRKTVCETVRVCVRACAHARAHACCMLSVSAIACANSELCRTGDSRKKTPVTARPAGTTSRAYLSEITHLHPADHTAPCWHGGRRGDTHPHKPHTDPGPVSRCHWSSFALR